jgi:hypothetical protein
MPYETDHYKREREAILKEARSLSKAAQQVGERMLAEVADHGAEIVFVAHPKTGNEEFSRITDARKALDFVRDRLSHH